MTSKTKTDLAAEFPCDELALEAGRSRARALRACGEALGVGPGDPRAALLHGLRVESVLARDQGVDWETLMRQLWGRAGVTGGMTSTWMDLRQLREWDPERACRSIMLDLGSEISRELAAATNASQHANEERRAQLERGRMVAAYLEVMADRGADGSRRIEAAAELEKLAPGKHSAAIAAMHAEMESIAAAYREAQERQEAQGRALAAEKDRARQERHARLLKLGEQVQPHELHSFHGADR